MSLRRTIAAVSLSAFALGGLAACGGDDDGGRETAPAPTTSAQETTVPTAEELTQLLDRASDPAVPVEEIAFSAWFLARHLAPHAGET